MTQLLLRTACPVQERNIKRKRQKEENGHSSNKETEVHKQVNWRELQNEGEKKEKNGTKK